MNPLDFGNRKVSTVLNTLAKVGGLLSDAAEKQDSDGYLAPASAPSLPQPQGGALVFPSFLDNYAKFASLFPGVSFSVRR